MTDVFVEFSTQLISERRAKEAYGDWSSERTFSVSRATLSDQQYPYEKFAVDAQINFADVVYVLWITYSTGDSFGWSKGNGEILWVFKDQALAVAAHQKWLAAQKNSKDDFDGTYHAVEFEADGGHKIKLNNPGWGYFDRLEQVRLQPMLVEGYAQEQNETSGGEPEGT